MKNKLMQIAYRCPDCGIATIGFPQAFGNASDMLRIKCECGGSALDITKQKDGKTHLSVPCVYCKDSHGYTLDAEMLRRQTPLLLSCPFSGMDIFFLNDGEKIEADLKRSADELTRIMQSLEAEELKDIQPVDLDSDDCPPDPAVFDTLNFIVRDLESDGKISCPCKEGKYDLRFCDEGMQVFCEKCGATYTFYAKSVSSAEEYLSLSSIKLG